MYYSSIGLLALLILFINNYYILFGSASKTLDKPHKAYRIFLFSVLIFYISDIIWGPLYELKILQIAFIETSLFFVAMSMSVLLWTRYVIAYINERSIFLKILEYTGFLFACAQIIVVIINIFTPIAFRFEADGTYQTGIARNLNLMFQSIMFLIVVVYMLFCALRSTGNIRRRHRAIGIFSATMATLVILQIYYPFMPFYSVGYMLGTCLLHTFVLEDEKDARREQLESILKVEKIQEIELGKTRQMAYSDPLTGVKNKMAYIEDVGQMEKRIEEEGLKDFGIVVFDLNDLKRTNDTQGHEAGDTYIKNACSLICNNFKHSPVYRIGGDEFVAFLTGEDYKNRDTILVTFNDIIEKNLESGGIVIAFGFADYATSSEKGFMRLFEQADKKMYKRKDELKFKKLQIS